MIEFTKGNILESDCQALVNTVNCFGKMGKGLALQFKKKFPEMFLAYKRACDFGQVQNGKMQLWKNPSPSPAFIVNFPTKDHWRNSSKMEWIVSGLEDLVAAVKKHEIKSIAIPPLGCGLGGLNWYLVREEIKKTHEKYWQDIKVVVFEP